MHDHRRSNVSIEGASATTAVCSFGERFLGDGPALRARLGGTARVDLDELASGAFSLVANHLDELPPRGVVNFFGQHAASETLDVQVFDGDPTEAIDKLPALFVQEVPARISDVRLMLRDSELALATHLRAPLATGKGALKAAELGGVAPRDARAVDGLAVAHRNETRQPEVDTNRVGAGAFGCRDFNVKHRVPLARVAGEDHRLRLTWQIAVPAHLDLAGGADERELAVLADRHAVADAEVGGVIAVASAEPGEARRLATPAATEECLERLVEFPHHLLLSGRGPASNVRKVSADDGQTGDLLVNADRDALLVGADAVFESGIVELAEVAQHLTQERGLRPVRFDAVAVAQRRHSAALLVLDISTDGCLGDMPHGAGEVRPRPQRRETRTQVRELLTKEPGRRPLEAVDDLGGRPRWVGLDEQVNVVRQHFRLVQQEPVLGGNLPEQLFKPGVDGRHKNRSPVLRAPHEVVLQTKHGPGVLCVAFSRHVWLYTRRTSNVNT